MASNNNLTSENKKRIADLLDSNTDEEIADIIGCTINKVRSIRARQSIYKHLDQKQDSISLLHAKHYWLKIREQLLSDEIRFFEQEWASYTLQFQDLVHTDELTMIDTIMLTIQINRILVQQRQTLEEISNIKQILKIEQQLPDEDQNKLAIKSYYETIASLQVALTNIGKQVESLQNTKDRKFSQLKVTREQRYKRIEESKKNVFELLKLLNERESREKENRTLSLIQTSTEKIKKEWMEPIEFPDGSRDSILLSEDTVEYLEGEKDE